MNDLVDVVNYEVPEGKPGIAWKPVEPFPYHGDRELLWRAMENLLRNALRHTDPDNGVILSLERGRKQVHLDVRDFGPGLPEARAGKDF